MKYILLLSLFFNFSTRAQTVITYEDFKKEIPFIEKEDFKQVFDQTQLLLKVTTDDSSDIRGIVVYMNIFSALKRIGFLY